MIQNIKVDIVYYMCPSDFEMEFNLCGCCRMRLLTDKATDRKALIGDMSRAISRSKIAIICGPLFEKSGLIYTTARAIGRELKPIDNAEYGINSDEKIEIIDNAFPLVTKDGVFGGLIIESGSQAIILLTESRDVRKTIMQTLIHPYIEDVSIASSRVAQNPLTDEAEGGKHSAEATAETTAEAVAENIEEAPEKVEAAEEKPDDKDYDIDAYEQLYVLKTEEIPEAKESEVQEDGGFYIETKKVSKKVSENYAKNYVPSEKDKMFISDIEETYDDVKREQQLKRWTAVVLTLLGITAFILIYYLLVIPLWYDIPYAEYIKILLGGN